MSRIQDKRTWLIGGAVAAAIIAAAGWFLVVSPVVSDTNDLMAQTKSVEQTNGQTEKKIHDLAAKQAQRALKQQQLAAALAALPMTSALPTFTRQLTEQARQAHVQLRNLDVGAFTVGAGSAPAGAPAASGTGATAAGTVASGGSGTSPTVGAAAAPAADAATGAGGVVSIAMTVVSFGRIDGQLRFLHLMQAAGPRRGLVTNTTVVGQSKNAAGIVLCNMTTQVTIYVTPKTSAERASVDKLLH